MNIEFGRDRNKGLSDLLDLRLGHARVADVYLGIRRLQVRPSTVQPIRFVGHVGLCDFEFLIQLDLEFGLHVLDVAFRNQSLFNQPVGINLQCRFVLLDYGIHFRLREHRLVAFVVAETPVAEDIDHDVLAEILPELGRNLRCVDDGLGVVAVHMEDRRLGHHADVGRIGRRSGMVRRGRETDLVVDHDVNRAAGLVSDQSRQTEALRYDPLSREGRVAVEKHRKHPLVLHISHLILLRARLPENDRIDRFQMGRVRGQ